MKLGLSCILGAGLACACVAENKLEPAKTASRVAGMEDAARAQAGSVEIIAQTEAWSDDALIGQAVTPVRVIIDNNGAEPVAIRYENMVLVAADGARYHALPPFEIEGEVPTVARDYAPISPYYGYDGFEPAPFYGPVYPGMSPFTGPFAYDPFYYGTYYRRWNTVELPTPEMLRRALPEGVLRAGGRVEGFVYFEKISDENQEVAFTVRLVDPRGEREAVRLSIPFVVSDK